MQQINPTKLTKKTKNSSIGSAGIAQPQVTMSMTTKSKKDKSNSTLFSPINKPNSIEISLPGHRYSTGVNE